MGLRPAPIPFPRWSVSQWGPGEGVKEQEARRADSPGLRPALWSSGMETKLPRKNACCPQTGGKSMPIVHSSKKVLRKKFYKNLGDSVSPGVAGW